jgi:hypothetical protein
VGLLLPTFLYIVDTLYIRVGNIILISLETKGGQAMIVKRLCANNAYVILSDGDMVDIDGKRFFDSMKELKDCLKPKGLTLEKNTVVLIKKQ